METQIQLSPKQTEYIRCANRRWNFKIGATQCGKTFIDVQYVIPSRIVERKGRKGLVVILGVTKETIERNVLEPMRDIWGKNLVSEINSRNYAILFGEKVYCLGAEKLSQVSKLRGAKFKYVYIDEVVDINEQVFQLLKSRLSLPYSVCDASGNPSFPSHFVKKFIDSAEDGVDIYCQNWTLYDNPFLDPSYVRALEAEYAGTVFLDRYVLGRWTQAEGLIYPMFPNAFESPFLDRGQEYALSIDYGTQNAFAGLLWVREDTTWHIAHEYRYSGRDTGRQKTDADYVEDMEKFVQRLPHDALHKRLPGGKEVDRDLTVFVDPSATSFIAALRRSKVPFRVRHADNSILDGLRDTAVCLQNGTVRIGNNCKELKKEIEGYVWDEKEDDTPIQYNDHLMDAMRYFVRTKRLVKPKPTSSSHMFG